MLEEGLAPKTTLLIIAAVVIVFIAPDDFLIDSLMIPLLLCLLCLITTDCKFHKVCWTSL